MFICPNTLKFGLKGLVPLSLDNFVTLIHRLNRFPRCMSYGTRYLIGFINFQCRENDIQGFGIIG